MTRNFVQTYHRQCFLNIKIEIQLIYNLFNFFSFSQFHPFWRFIYSWVPIIIKKKSNCAKLIKNVSKLIKMHTSMNDLQAKYRLECVIDNPEISGWKTWQVHTKSPKIKPNKIFTKRNLCGAEAGEVLFC